MSLHRPAVLLAVVGLAACGPEFEGLEPTDTLDSAESGMTAQACTTTQQLLANPGFESGNVAWQVAQTGTRPVIANYPTQARTGSWRAHLSGTHMTGDQMRQLVTIPATACAGTFTFWLKITSTETGGEGFLDALRVHVADSRGGILEPPLQFDSRQAGAGYVKGTIPLFSRTNYRGQQVYVHFTARFTGLTDTQFFVDDTALTITR
jgi:hypothetical protein